MTRLSVNLNKVALVRNARAGLAAGGRPDLLTIARAALDGGADGVTLHPRPDGRHARAADAHALAAWLPEGCELNLEGNPFAGPGARGGYDYPGFVALVRAVRPTQVTLVPDAAGQLTSDHGWDLDADGDRLRPLIRALRADGLRVSLFLDADAERMAAAADLGADRVELYTGPYALAAADGHEAEALPRYAHAARAARRAGLAVNAGHDLDLDNLTPFLRAVPGVAEVSIGQALVADALERGMAEAVRAYLHAIAAAA